MRALDSDTDTGVEPYPSTAVVLAVVATLVAPVISLIVALVLRSSERNAVRRTQLRSWAIGSGVYLGISFLVVLMLVASISSRSDRDESGPCEGGPEIGAAAEPIGGDRYRVPCAISGSAEITLP